MLSSLWCSHRLVESPQSEGTQQQKQTAQQTQNICITFIQCWTNVEDVGPALYKCYTNVLCLLGVSLYCIIFAISARLKNV